jgi:hypothetical protein
MHKDIAVSDGLMTAIDRRSEDDELIWDPEKRWWLGKVNTYASVTSDYALPPRASVVDVTLREAEEVPGTMLTVADKLEIAHAVAEAGYAEMEVGYAGAIDEHREFVRRLKRENLPVALASHTRS